MRQAMFQITFITFISISNHYSLILIMQILYYASVRDILYLVMFAYQFVEDEVYYIQYRTTGTCF